MSDIPHKKNQRRRLKPSERAQQEEAKAKKGKPRVSKRTRAQIAAEAAKSKHSARNLEIYNKYCEGKSTQRELSDQYGLARSAIYGIIKQVEDEQKVLHLDIINRWKHRATERFELIFANAMKSYTRSCENEVTITEENTVDGKKVTIKTRGQAGDASHLQAATKATEQILKTWGAQEAKKVKIVGEDPKQGTNLASFFRERFAAARNGHDSN